MSKINLIAAIASAFAMNPKEDKLLVTADGNCFTKSSRSAAEYHARKTNQTLKEVSREEYTKDIDEAGKQLAERNKKITANEKLAGKGKKDQEESGSEESETNQNSGGSEQSEEGDKKGNGKGSTKK